VMGYGVSSRYQWPHYIGHVINMATVRFCYIAGGREVRKGQLKSNEVSYLTCEFDSRSLADI